MSKRILGLMVATAVVATLGVAASRSSAGPDKIVFPASYKDGVLYTIADRYDVKQYRELYATPAAVQAAKEGKPLPSWTVLTLVQYKAQVDAQGNPIKDAKGRFLKGDLIAYTAPAGAPSIRTISGTGSGSTPPSEPTASSTTRPTTRPASSATSLTTRRTS